MESDWLLRCLQREFEAENEKLVKKYGMLRKYDDSQEFLTQHSQLVCEETANSLVLWCIELEMEEVRGRRGCGRGGVWGGEVGGEWDGVRGRPTASCCGATSSRWKRCVGGVGDCGRGGVGGEQGGVRGRPTASCCGATSSRWKRCVGWVGRDWVWAVAGDVCVGELV